MSPPSQSCKDALNTTTPDLADLYRYRTMHIYLWQITPLQSCIYAFNTITSNLAHVYIYIYKTMHIYQWQIDLPSHLNIDALNTATPNLADVPPVNQA